MSNVIQSIGNLQIFSILLITWVVRPLARPPIKAPNQGPQSRPPIKALNQGPQSRPSIKAPNQGPQSRPSIQAPNPLFCCNLEHNYTWYFPRFLPVLPVFLCRRHRQKHQKTFAAGIAGAGGIYTLHWIFDKINLSLSWCPSGSAHAFWRLKEIIQIKRCKHKL